jgi:hypothetical protein
MSRPLRSVAGGMPTWSPSYRANVLSLPVRRVLGFTFASELCIEKTQSIQRANLVADVLNFVTCAVLQS